MMIGREWEERKVVSEFMITIRVRTVIVSHRRLAHSKIHSSVISISGDYSPQDQQVLINAVDCSALPGPSLTHWRLYACFDRSLKIALAGGPDKSEAKPNVLPHYRAL
jgi:hypothetical protein